MNDVYWVIYHQTLPREKDIPHILSLSKLFFSMSVYLLFIPLMMVINFKYYFDQSFIICVFFFQVFMFYLLILRENKFIEVASKNETEISIKNYYIYISICFFLIGIIIISMVVDIVL